MVTGPAASGKSTLCKNLTETLPAYFYKPSYAYFELANKHNIPKEKMLVYLSIIEEEIVKLLLKIQFVL